MTDEKPHGKIVNKNSGVEIPGTLRGNSVGYISLLIDGTTGSHNSFYTKDWDFVPDPPDLPKGTGAVVQIAGYMPIIKVGSNTWVMPMVGGGGFAEPIYNKPRMNDADVRSLISKLGLVAKLDGSPDL